MDVKTMKVADHKLVAARAMYTMSPNYQKHLDRIKSRLDKVDMRPATVEVRFQDLSIEADVLVGSSALPSVPHAMLQMAQAPFRLLGAKFGSDMRRLHILDGVSGCLQPGRFTLLVGPPGSGKSSLLKALAGKLASDGSLRVSGNITYNGHTLDEFVAPRTSSYIDQHDIHIAEMTVRETMDFSAQCQGVGAKAAELQELAEREAQLGIVPRPEIDAFMKAEAHAGGRHSIMTEVMLRLLGLDYVADSLVGGKHFRGISGGQKKRLTTGEMTVGPKQTLFLDEISTGLDSSTTFQVVQTLANLCHTREATILLSLLQPAPEVFMLFDDIMLLSEGRIVFHGPREEVLPFFSSMGFQLPERKATADFLQEVTSPHEQAQYWASEKPYSSVSVPDFVAAFQKTETAQRMQAELDMPFDRAASADGTLIKRRYGLGPVQMLQALWRRELTLVARNALVLLNRFIQALFNGFMVATLFAKGTRSQDSIDEAGYYLGAIFFSMVSMLLINWAEAQTLLERLPAFYKQRDNFFYSSATFYAPMMALSVPQSFIESLMCSVIIYWGVGLQPAASGFFTFWLFSFLIHNWAIALFRFIAAACRHEGVTNSMLVVSMVVILNTSGIAVPRAQLRWWWRWVLYVNPLSWADRALALTEFRASRWDSPTPVPGVGLGDLFLKARSFENDSAWIWGGVGYIVAANVLCNAGAIACLQWLKAPSSHGSAAVLDDAGGPSLSTTAASSKTAAGGRPVAIDVASEHSDALWKAEDMDSSQLSSSSSTAPGALPFPQLWLTFQHLWYSVDLPATCDPPEHPRNVPGVKPRLYLLNDVSGCFRPGVLTALIGETGAGKTTLLDVLAGRKTSGLIEGDIRVQGHPKDDATFARVSGFIEQTDIHSPQTTVREALLFSASLRLQGDVSHAAMHAFVDEVTRVVELEPLQNALVGVPGHTGLSVEQRKRLTIAVELVANPSIVLMDEPTSGLDARAAAIVMRAVRNTVDTGRTVVCTIHQPSIDVFESFDELLLMKRGGRIIYNATLGPRSSNLISYFEGIGGVPPIAADYNPATWALDVTTGASERRCGVNFADAWEASSTCKATNELIEALSVPSDGSQPLHFDHRRSRTTWQQYRLCLGRWHTIYWRTPSYSVSRMVFTIVFALIFGTTYWAVGSQRSTEFDIQIIVAALFCAAVGLGLFNGDAVRPVVAVERSVYYRERAAGLYGALPYSMSHLTVELPYILLQAVLYSVVVYPLCQYRWEAAPFLFFLLFEFLALLFFTTLSIATTTLTPNQILAFLVAGAVYFIMAIEAGYFLPGPATPWWHRWLHYADPIAWLLYGQAGSQLGNVETTIQLVATGEVTTVSQYVADFYGFHYHLLGVPAAVLVAETAVLWMIVTWAYAKVNWEKR